MTNYVKSTNFTVKDSLPTGDTNKVIRGAEFDTEFNDIATAITTKSNIASPTFTGTVTIANLTASGTINFTGATISNLGTITTANLDGGTADNIVIGGVTPAAGTFTALAASSSLTLGGVAVLTSVTFSNLDAGAVTTSSETFANSDTQIPTNAAVKAHVEAVIPALTVTEASVTQHQAALAITASQLSDVTSTAAELNYLDIATLGLTAASKAVTADVNGVVSFDNGTIDEATSVTSSSNAATINLRDGNVFEHDLTENVTYTFSNPAASGRASAFVLKIIQDSSARTITWPGSVDWIAATAPTLTATNNGVDVFVFFTINGGTTYYGFTAGQALG